MGDPRKIRAKYSGPRHPWEGARIENEKGLTKNYGLKNKKDIWRMESQLTKFKDQVKRLTALGGEQAEKEKMQLSQKLQSLGLIKEGDSLNSVLGLDVNSLMERRLQSVVVKMGYAHTMKQARQFIVHRHVTVNGKKITAPSYLVREGEAVGFSDGSALKSETHPERLEKKPSNEKIEKPKEEKTEAKEEKKDETKEETPSKASDEKKEEVKEEAPAEEKPADAGEEKKEETKEEVAEEKVEEKTEEVKEDAPAEKEEAEK